LHRFAGAEVDKLEEAIISLLPQIDLLVVWGNAGMPAKKLAGSVPTVFISIGFPVELGLVQSLAHRQAQEEELRKASQILEVSLTDMLVEASTASEYQRVFREIAPHPPDAIIVSSTVELFPYRRLIVDLAEKAACRRYMPFVITWRQAG
jgi:hypothetical protein